MGSEGGQDDAYGRCWMPVLCKTSIAALFCFLPTVFLSQELQL